MIEDELRRYTAALAALLKERRFTGRELDRRLGWEQGNTTRLLRGKRELRVGQILAILKVLEVEPLAFYTSVHGDRSLATRVVAGLGAPSPPPLLLPPAMSEEEFSRRVREAVLQALAAREPA